VLILDNATLVDLDAGELRPGHFVCIDGDTIVSVDDRRPSSEAAERIDLAGRCLLPGLIDAHYHATLTDTNPANLRDAAGNPLADLGLLQNQGQQLTLIMKNGAIIKRAA
jgi:imidazolonepropionase-like amidohydrolase